jgi:hypothetical protein
MPGKQGKRHPRAGKGERRLEELREQIDARRNSWSRIVIPVDGMPVQFEAVSVGDCSAAVAFLDEVYIAIWSRGVELGDLRLSHD